MFRTGKAGLHDLTQDDRERLNGFVTNKARNIALLARYYNTSALRP
jgi:hypothetical protein